MNDKSSAPIQIVTVERPADVRAFVDTGYRLNERYPQFVTQLRMDLLALFDRKKNPFWDRAEYQLFLAKREGKIVGRIAAIDNHAHNDFHHENIGHWGFFDAFDDPAIAKALFEAAEKWVRDRGRDAILGPMNPSTNDECGTLIDAFDESPIIMMTWNPEYYPALIEGCGYSKAKDLYAWWMSADDFTDRYQKAAEFLRKKLKAEIRCLDMKHFWDEVTLIKEVYNAAWAKNWGFFPMTDEEIDHLAKQLHMIVDPDFTVFAFIEGKLVGFSLTLPDYYQVLKGIRGGKLFPFGLLKVLWNQYVAKKIKQSRVMVMGVVPEFRNRGIDVIFYAEAVRVSKLRGHRGGEMSWILEDNDMMNNILEKIGGKIYKHYRIYRKDLV